MKEEIIKVLEKTGAFQKGHFRLSSGLHSDTYIQCAQLLKYPKYCIQISKEILKLFKGCKIQTVISPALGGVILGYELARQLNCKNIFTERKDKIMSLRRGFNISEGEKILVAEDVITTGSSTKEVMDIVTQNGGDIVGIACIVNRSSFKKLDNIPIKSLIELSLETYPEQQCPLCKNKIPVYIPGSKY